MSGICCECVRAATLLNDHRCGAVSWQFVWSFWHANKKMQLNKIIKGKHPFRSTDAHRQKKHLQHTYLRTGQGCTCLFLHSQNLPNALSKGGVRHLIFRLQHHPQIQQIEPVPALFVLFYTSVSLQVQQWLLKTHFTRKVWQTLSVLQSLRKSSSQFSCDTDVSAQKCAHPLQVFSVYWGCCFWKAKLQASMGGGTNVYACVCMLHVVVHSCRMFVWSILDLRTKEKLRRQDDKMSRLRKRTVRETCIACVLVISDDF